MKMHASPLVTDLVSALKGTTSIVAAELRPPRAELATREGMDAWIDTYHAVRRLTQQGTYVFLTDSAVGLQEEDNLRHLIANLGKDAPRPRVVPFLTSKHPLEFCLSYGERAHQSGFSTLVVLGGDKTIGIPRSVEHAWQLREMLHAREHRLSLGGWANPYANPERQVEYLAASNFHAEFYLTQIVSHHDLAPVRTFLETGRRRSLELPGLFGVFFYRSANRRTLETLNRFLRVPVDGLTSEFAAGVPPEEVCARTIRALRDLGARHVYISNLPIGRASATLDAILRRI